MTRVARVRHWTLHVELVLFLQIRFLTLDLPPSYRLEALGVTGAGGIGLP